MGRSFPNASKGRGFEAAAYALLERIAWAVAMIGGAIILGVSIVIALSVTRRALGFGGITGDFEIVEIGCGIAAFLFMPICQMKRGHVSVDLFSAGFPDWLLRFFEGLWDLLFAAVWGVLVWRFSQGMMEKLDYADRSMLLHFPLWTIYLPAIASAVLSAIIAVKTAHRKWTGRVTHVAGGH